MTSNTLLKIDNLNVNYGEFRAIRNVSIEVPEGTVTSIIGANGSGKSTLLQAVSGLLRPESGVISFQGKDITGYLPHQIVDEGISLVPEGGKVFISLSILENLLIGAYTPKARRNSQTLLRQVYNTFPVLEEKSRQLAGNLSGGQRQMLAIGRALMSKPKLIMFDEISLGLAPNIIKDIYQQIKRINQDGTTVILVEQDVKRSLKASERSYVLLEGKVVLQGNSKELSDESVRRAYFGI